MVLLPTDIQTQRQKKSFLIFRYFSLFFLTDLILSDQADKNMGRYREFQDLSENVPTSNRYPNSGPKNIIFDIFFFSF